MSRKVYAYSNIKDLMKHPKYDEIKELPHITATTGLANVIKDYYRFNNENSTVSIHEISKSVVEDWDSEDTVFLQYVHLEKIIRNSPQNDVVLGFKRNKHNMLNAARILTEAGIRPSDIQETCVEESIFKSLWSELENEEESFGKFRARIEGFERDPSTLLSLLKRMITKIDSDSMVLHGFYFITPIQERIFDILEKSGKTLIFLCRADRTHIEASRIWYENFTPEFGYPSYDEWVYDDLEILDGKAFFDLFEVGISHHPLSNVKIIKYKDVMEFISDVDRICNDGSVLFSANLQKTSDILKEFYPDRFKMRHLLAYPVGQYIYCLYKMWDPIEGKLNISFEEIQKCFSSGWVCCNGLQGKDYLSDLEKMATYFKGCNSISDWELRLETLSYAINNVVKLFERHIEDNGSIEVRWHKLMGNPFRNMSVFACDTNRMNEVVLLLRHLLRTAKSLFEDDMEVKLEEHLNTLKDILDTRADMENILKEEKVIINELLKRLGNNQSSVEECFPGDLSEAIMMLIGGGFFDEDSFSVQVRMDEEFVKPIYHAEASQLIGKKIHLCMCDQESMPGKPSNYPWPITDKMIEELQHSGPMESRKYLRDMRFIVEAKPLCNRYLFSELMMNNEIEISWIAGTDNEEIAPSPYLKLIETVFGIKPTSGEVQQLTLSYVKGKPKSESKIHYEYEIDTKEPSEVKLDLALCPLKYLYGYVLQDLPSYTSEFHYSFVLSKMIGAFARVAGYQQKKVGERLFEILPYLREIESRQIIDYSSGKSDSGTEEYDNVSYNNERLKIHFLVLDILAKAQKKWEEISSNGPVYGFDFIRPDDNRSVCMYCQNIDFCKEALFAVDEE